MKTHDCAAWWGSLLLLLLPAAVQPVLAGTDPECLRGFLETGSDDLTLGEMRARCAVQNDDEDEPEDEMGIVARRLAVERESAARSFSILAHRPNYVLPAAYNFEHWNVSNAQSDGGGAYRAEDLEMQFQFSLKVPVAVNLFGGSVDIFAAYTNRSFWQMYDRDNSEPFRETNHEPELFAQLRNDWEMLGFRNAVNALGWVHQSNGKAGPSSRSWNRLYANFIFEKRNLALSFRPWIWISKDKANSDNPDITDYMGHGEFRAAWQRHGHVYSLMLRNQVESGFDRGALELGWSFPVFDYPFLKGYLQYFRGYGESLIDYDNKVNRIGLGISVTDWLD